MSGMVVIFMEFPVWHWHFDPVLNDSVISESAAMKVYIFHDCPFQTPVMSSFFRPYQPFGKVTLDDIRPYFQPPRYLTDDDTDSDTCLTMTVSVDSDPSELSHPSYHVETDPSEPSYLSVIRLTSDSSSSSSSTHHHTPSLVRGRGFIRISAMPHGHGYARGGRRGDVTPGGFGNGYLPPDE